MYRVHMMTKQQFDFDKWEKRILKIKDPINHQESLEFWALVDGLENVDNISSNKDVARILFQTFTDKHDHGVKQSVVRNFGLFDLTTYYKAYFEELPSLFNNTQKRMWYFMLADYPEIDLSFEDVDLIISICKDMPLDVQELFQSIVSDEDFIEEYDWAEYMLGKLIKK